VAALLGLLGLVAVGTARLATTAAASTAGASAVSLVDDDGGAALFSSSGLRPGAVQAACVGLSAAGSVDPSSEVSLTADARTGGLAPYLQVWVERGAVPAGGSCADFSGSVIWTGTLDRFPVTGTAGIATGWRPALTPHSVYRFTVSVLDDPRAQALRTSASFRWAFSETGAAPVAPMAVPTTAAPTRDAARVGQRRSRRVSGRPIVRLVRDDGVWFSRGDRVSLRRTPSAPEELHAVGDPNGPCVRGTAG
jgi:hypothetical protein